eukprot:scaffold25077_cov48-Cyclotella_meneghiniana.AAC.2
MVFYLHDVAEGANSCSANAGNAPSDDEGVLDEDCWEFGSAASSELEDEGHRETSSPRPHNEASSPVELAPPAFGLPSVVDPADSSEIEPITTAPADEERKPPSGKSIAHFDLQDGNIVFLSLDLETGGEYWYCGIIQLSGQLFRQNMADTHHKTYITVEETFNQYVRPPEGAFWNEEACRLSHGLTPQSPQIQNGLPFITVWTNFCEMDRLLKDNNLTSNCRGRILYTDNWYTTMALAHHLYNKYGYFFCGTMVPIDKKARQDMDVPFLKLSNGAKDKVPRGWFREAYVEVKTDTSKIFCIQHTTWKDRKNVHFLHTTDIGASSGHFVQRSGRGQQGRATFAAPNAQRDYARHFNVVDRNDRDSADYTTSLRTNRWYLRVFFWLLDRVVHQLYVIIIYCARNAIGPPEWTDYLKKHGRRKFQIDLGRDLMSYAIRNSWNNIGAKPNWMRQTAPLPCEFDKCFFCLNSLTTGVDHKRQKRTVTHFVQHDRTRTKTVDCTNKRVNLQMGTSHCKQCYRERTGTRAEKLDGINKSCMGCPSCEERICKECWEKGYDMHQK